jgi:lipoic acid synthetase
MTTTPIPSREAVRLPRWLKKEIPSDPAYFETKALIKDLRLQTVCEDARCPNMGECWSKGHVTVMILGTNCTRTCSFCSVPKGDTSPVDSDEPRRLTEAMKNLRARYLVITSVNRDDLSDGGASQFAKCIRGLREAIEGIEVEILTPDFQYSLETSLDALAEDLPDIWAHNIETVDRLSRKARIKGSHEATLACLSGIKKRYPWVPTKSGIMVGMGETDEEVVETLKLLRDVGVTQVTIGQYLRPTPKHMPVKEYIVPEKFLEWDALCQEMGFTEREVHPYARSSFRS